MAKTIHKYPFDINDFVAISLPEGAEILHVEVQRGEPCVWALVDPEAVWEKRKFYISGTGHPADHVRPENHVATFTQRAGDFLFVWHMFEDHE